LGPDAVPDLIFQEAFSHRLLAANRQRGSPRAHGFPIGRDATTWSDSRAGRGRSRHAEAHSRDLRWTRTGPALRAARLSPTQALWSI
jgi:hypothetical protein